MMENNLPYPYNVAFEHGDSIDYRVGDWSKESDHSYVKKLGYTSQMASDCSYYAEGLNGFSLSSYGDWGTFYADWGGEKEKEMFLDMYNKDIIRLWRIRTYIKKYLPLSKDWLVHSFDYEEGIGWKTYDDGEKKWVMCDDPYKTISETEK